jgi:hypothetical protein
MLCGEIEDIAKKGTLSHETLDVLKDLVETEKNLEKIKKYKKEEEMEMDGGYSQRKYFIDADYQPGMGNSYARGSRNMYDMGGNSYARGNSYMDNNSYMRGSYMDGNSYMYYDPRYENPMYSMTRGYSGHTTPEMVTELKKIMAETKDEKVRSSISELLGHIQ